MLRVKCIWYILCCYHSTATVLIHNSDKMSQSIGVVIKRMHVLNTGVFAVSPTFIFGIDSFSYSLPVNN